MIFSQYQAKELKDHISAYRWPGLQENGIEYSTGYWDNRKDTLEGTLEIKFYCMRSSYIYKVIIKTGTSGAGFVVIQRRRGHDVIMGHCGMSCQHRVIRWFARDFVETIEREILHRFEEFVKLVNVQFDWQKEGF